VSKLSKNLFKPILAKSVGAFVDGKEIYLAEAHLTLLGKKIVRSDVIPASAEAVAKYFGTPWVPPVPKDPPKSVSQLLPSQRKIEELLRTSSPWVKSLAKHLLRAPPEKKVPLPLKHVPQTGWRILRAELPQRVARCEWEVSETALPNPVAGPADIPKKPNRLTKWIRDFKGKRRTKAAPPTEDVVAIPVKKTKWMEPILSVGIAPHSLFFASGTFSREAGKGAVLDDLISENPRFAFMNSNDLYTDWRITKVKDQKYVHISAAKKKLIAELNNLFRQADMVPLRIEPGPWAALRASWNMKEVMPPMSCEIRILVGSAQSLVAYTLGNNPLAWNCLEMDISREPLKLISAVQSLSVFVTKKLRITAQPKMVIQSPEPVESINQALEPLTDKPLVILSGPSFDGHLVAKGLAFGALDPQARALNLKRVLAEPTSIKQIFPRWKTVISLAALLLLLGYFGFRIGNLNETLGRVKKENDLAAWSVRSNKEELLSQQQKAETETAPMSTFLTDRLRWTPVIDKAIEVLPPNAWLLGVEGADLLWEKGGSNNKGERWMEIRFAAAFPLGGATPYEIEDSLQAYRDDPVFKKDLPHVELGNISFKKEGKQEQAVFSIVALQKEIKISKLHTGKGKKDDKGSK